MTSGGVLLEEERKWCVYIHRNIINNKAYIGITCQKPERRWRDGEGYHDDQGIFYRAIQKYGWDNFEHIIWTENLTEEEAKKWEIRLIALFKTNCCRHRNPEYGYNMTDGGDGSGKSGHPMSEENKKRMIEFFTGREVPQEQREKISIGLKKYYEDEDNRKRLSELAKKRFEDPKNHPFFGKHHTDDTKEKMSQSKKELYSNPENHPMYGRHHTEEAKRKNRNAHIGKIASDETRKKLSELKKGKFLGENSPCSKKILQFNTDGEFIREFNALREIERVLGYSRTPIIRCCKHKPHCNTAYGFIWMYKEEYEKINNINGGNKENE